MSRPVTSFAVAGIKYRQKTYDAAHLQPGDLLALQWDLENGHDPWAIAVYKGRHHIGFVPRELTWRLHRFRELKIRLMCRVDMCDGWSCHAIISAESDPKEKPIDFDCILE